MQQFTDAVDVGVRVWCGSVEVAFTLIFAQGEDMDAQVRAAAARVEATSPAQMSLEWFESTITIFATTSVLITNAQILAPSPPPPRPPPLPEPMAPPPVSFQEQSVDVAAAAPAIVTSTTAAVIASLAFSGGASVAFSALSSSGSGFAGGGGMMPLLFGVQRFAGSTGLGAPAGELQSSVAGSMAWTEGELFRLQDFGLLSPSSSPPDSSARRLLSSGADAADPIGNASSGGAASEQQMPLEMVALINLLITGTLAVLLTFALQAVLVSAWKHLINRRYYQQQLDIAAAKDEEDEEALRKAIEWDKGRERFCCGVFGPKRKLKPPKFVPFPKSLVWPTPLFFTGCIFVTGLTRASVRVLAAQPDGCSMACLAVPIVVLFVLVGLLLLTAVNLILVHKRHGNVITWKSASKHGKPAEVGDPYMRLQAQLRIQAVSIGLVARHRTSGMRRSAALSLKKRKSTVAPTKYLVPDPAQETTEGVPVVRIASSDTWEGPVRIASSDPWEGVLVEELKEEMEVADEVAPPPPPEPQLEPPPAEWLLPPRERSVGSMLQQLAAARALKAAQQPRSRAPSSSSPRKLKDDAVLRKFREETQAPLRQAMSAFETAKDEYRKLAEAHAAAVIAFQQSYPDREIPRCQTDTQPEAQLTRAQSAHSIASRGPIPRASSEAHLSAMRIRPDTAAAESLPVPRRLELRPCARSSSSATICSPRSSNLQETMPSLTRAMTQRIPLASPDPRFGSARLRPSIVPECSPQPEQQQERLAYSVSAAQLAAVQQEHQSWPRCSRSVSAAFPALVLSPRSSQWMLDLGIPPEPPPSPPSTSNEALCSATHTDSARSVAWFDQVAAAETPGHVPAQPDAASDAAVGDLGESDDETVAPAQQRKRLSLAEARVEAARRLSERGHRDRKSGGFDVPESDTQEPERTERLLARPYRLYYGRAGDAFQAIEGFLFFRVNGSNRVGVGYRLIVIGVNMIFGLLSGLQPMLTPGSGLALMQTFLILTLQLGMSFICFCFLPDADRIISRFAGSQFLLEGLSTAALFAADRRSRDVAIAIIVAREAALANQTLPNGTLANDTLANGIISLDGNSSVLFGPNSTEAQLEAKAELACLCKEGRELVMQIQYMGFVFAMIAMAVPILQLLEQRCLTPTIGVVRSKGGNPLALMAAAYMMAASLPRLLTRLISSAEDGPLDAAQAAQSATADAGDEAVVDEGGGGGGDTGGDTGVEVEQLDECDPGGEAEAEANEEESPEETGEVELSADQITDAGARVSRLLARAVAAREVAAKNCTSNATSLPTLQEDGGGAGGSSMSAVVAMARVRGRAYSTRRSTVGGQQQADDDDDADDMAADD